MQYSEGSNHFKNEIKTSPVDESRPSYQQEKWKRCENKISQNCGNILIKTQI